MSMAAMEDVFFPREFKAKKDKVDTSPLSITDPVTEAFPVSEEMSLPKALSATTHDELDFVFVLALVGTFAIGVLQEPLQGLGQFSPLLPEFDVQKVVNEAPILLMTAASTLLVAFFAAMDAQKKGKDKDVRSCEVEPVDTCSV